MIPSSKPYLTTLTPLRGIAALLVAIFHSNMMIMPFRPWDKPHFIWASWLWVDFFFILSGFIIYYIYGRLFENSLKADEYWKYIKARFARVYPLYVFTLIWCLICAIIILHYAKSVHPYFRDMLSPSTAIPSLLFLQSFGLYISAPLNSPSWSLSTEWWVYMIFPLIVPIFSRMKNRGMIIAFLVIAGFFVFIKYILGPLAQPFPGGPPTLNVITDFGLLRCLAGFLAGMLLFRVYEEAIGQNFFKRSWVFIVLFASVLLAMQTNVEDIIIVAFFPLIILSAAYNTTEVKRTLEISILQRLGDWSFSIYMVHVPIMYLFWIFLVQQNPLMYAELSPNLPSQPVHRLGLIFVMVLLTLITASTTYRYIEVPARGYLNKRFNQKN